MQAVIFDLGGVVFRYTPEQRWQRFAEITGEDPKAVRKRMLDSGYARACDCGELNLRKSYLEGVRLLGRRLSMEHFTQIWISAFKPDDAVIELVQALKHCCAVALLSNNSLLTQQGLDLSYPHVMELFRPRLFSADLGLLKPDPGTFASMLKLLDTEAPQTLLIDDASANTATAAALGLMTHDYRDAAALRLSLQQAGLL